MTKSGDVEYCIEKNFLGEKNILFHLYWGIYRQRAKDNFSLSSYGVHFRLIKALAMIKKACALANGKPYLGEKILSPVSLVSLGYRARD